MTPEEIAAMKAENEKSKADLAAAKADADKYKADLEKATKKPDPPDPSLADKAKKEREAAEAAAKHEKGLESAIAFNHSSKDFLKNNAALIPKSIEGLFAQAEKENYGSAVAKANAIKVGIVSEYFAVQANHDLLTPSQKIELEEFSKLTKNVKEERVDRLYSMIFEPTLESARKIEKAKQIGKGLADSTDTENAYLNRIKERANKRLGK